MKLKNNKGYVGIDASVAVLILLILVPTIVGMIYNSNKTNSLIDRKTQAINISINTIEAMKGIGVDVINDTTKNIETELATSLSSIYTLNGEIPISKTDVNNVNTINGLSLTKDDNTYKITVEIQDYADTTEGKAQSAQQGYVKIVRAIVEYKFGKEIENVELSTVISKE